MAAQPSDASGVLELHFGDHRVAVDAAHGGRIVSFAHDGFDVIAGREVGDESWGSTFWTSPQSDWHWPPPRELDRAPYRVVERAGRIVVESQLCPTLGVQVQKEIAPLVDGSGLEITYTIVRQGAGRRSFAPWEVTRVPPGLTFLASRQRITGSLPALDFAGILWFDHPGTEFPCHHHLHADSSEGWVGHVVGHYLFVKTFPVVPRRRQAPGEGSVEVYAHDDGSYVELEAQGPFLELGPGDRLSWSVRWHLQRYSGDCYVGAAELVQTARRLAAAAVSDAAATTAESAATADTAAADASTDDIEAMARSREPA